MSIDWPHFAPWHALAGGMLIGVAVVLLVLFAGRIAGISGIAGGLLLPRYGDIAWRLSFIGGLRLAPLHFMSNGLHQVGLAHTHGPVKEERVIAARGVLSHRQRGCVRELVAAADDE